MEVLDTETEPEVYYEEEIDSSDFAVIQDTTSLATNYKGKVQEEKNGIKQWLWDKVDEEDELKIFSENKPTPEVEWMCGLCYNWYEEKEELDTHMKEVHLNYSRFQKCRYCDKLFLARFLCLRHEKRHKFNMDRPLCHYFPPKGKPIDYFVENHFTKAQKPAKLTKPMHGFIRVLINRLANQLYKCLECSKVFLEEELLTEHYNMEHALQQCKFCQEYFENFTELQIHEFQAHGYLYKQRDPAGAWGAWEKEEEDALEFNHLVRAHIEFFHNYAKDPSEEPIVSPVKERVHIRKSIIPPTGRSFLKPNLSISYIANKILKTAKGGHDGRARHVMYNNRTLPSTIHHKPDSTLSPSKPRPFQTPFFKSRNYHPHSSVSTSHGHKTASQEESNYYTPTNELFNGDPANTEEISTSEVYSQENIVNSNSLDERTLVECSEGIVSSSSSVSRSPESDSQLSPKDLDEKDSLENSDFNTNQVTSLNSESEALNQEFQNHSQEEYSEKLDGEGEPPTEADASPINEEERIDNGDIDDFSDTPPELDNMNENEPMNEEEAMDESEMEARDPEEEGIESVNYDENNYDPDDMLIIDEGTPYDLPFRCSFCPKVYDNPLALEKHLQRHHSSERPFPCQFCGQRFVTQSNRKEHERIHTGERPYICLYCQKGFTQISNLKKHLATHKEQNLRLDDPDSNSALDLKCQKCGKQFVKEASLILHQRAHSADRRFRCHICDRAYNYASLLKRHMRIHTGELPYECDMCGVLFHELVSLHYHRKKIHTGERPHKCDVCGRAFILSSDLKKHVNVHIVKGEGGGDGQAAAAAANSETNKIEKPPRLARRTKFPFKKRRGKSNNVNPITGEVMGQNSQDGAEDGLKTEGEEGSDGRLGEVEEDTPSQWLEPEVHMSCTDEAMEFE